LKELTVEAKRENLLLVQALIDEELEAADCQMATQIAIDVAVEELFVNIASYAAGARRYDRLLFDPVLSARDQRGGACNNHFRERGIRIFNGRGQ
jgi:hypothetical protein